MSCAQHLNTPRLVADATGTTVWRWDQGESFGSNLPDENPSGLGAFDLPLRLPGQYFDAETGLHYNYFRDYDPSIGRYGESDPIGLNGGLNTYAYAIGSPLSYFDPDGQKVRLICRPLGTWPGSWAWDHCFVHVTCPEQGIDKTFSVFGNPPWIFSSGYKSEATPETFKTRPDYPDNPAKKNKYDREIEPCNNRCCAYEKEVIAKFSGSPDTMIYHGTVFNSNNFARVLVTSPRFCASVPADAPTDAAGIR